MSREAAIGIFDSGVGGLTVVHALLQALPAEHLVYLGDTGRYPYGTKSAETVTRYSVENTEFLLARNVKLLVVACNSASSVALGAIAARAGVPVVGVIEPGARAALSRSRTRRIGVIGTDATIGAGEYTRALRAGDPAIEVYTRACPLFVPLAEEGWTGGAVVRQVAETYLGTLARSGMHAHEEGFDLHAAVLVAAGDRDRLARLCRRRMGSRGDAVRDRWIGELLDVRAHGKLLRYRTHHGFGRPCRSLVAGSMPG